MLLVFPVSTVDAKLAAKLPPLFKKLGGTDKHDLLVVGAINARSQAEKLLGQLAPLFAESSLFVPDSECETGWPHSANHIWVKTMAHLRKNGVSKPWYWFEADNTPIKKGWLDLVETEYHQSGKPFLGAVQATRLVDRKTGEFVRTDGEHLIGTCVYPSWYPIETSLWTYVDFRSPTVEPFDVYLRHEIRPQAAVAATIHSNWRTKNYEIGEEGCIYCEPIDESSVVNPVPATAAVVHGCKDGSLAKLMLK